MPSRAYTSFLQNYFEEIGFSKEVCQCPLGLIPHFYIMKPFEIDGMESWCVNALSGLYLISTKMHQSLMTL